MAFRVKDLMITVVPEAVEAQAKLCLLHTRICLRPTFCLCTRVPTLCHYGCTHYSPTCLGCSYQWPSIICHLRCSRVPSFWECPGGTQFEGCPGGSVIIEEGPLVINRVEDIKALRADLQETLKRLDEVEEQGLDVLPEGDELEALEAKLKEALEEISARRR